MMISLVIVVSAVSFSMIYLYWKQNFSKFSKNINHFPGPPNLPLIGSVYVFWSTPEEIFKTFRKFASKYLQTYSLWSANVAALNIVSPEDAEIILTSNKHITKSFVYNFIGEWLGRGLLTSTDKKWHHRRKMLSSSFHFNILHKFVVMFGEHSQKLVDIITKQCCESEVNVIPIISKSTLQIICETAMGTTLDLHNEIQNKYFQSIYKIAEIITERTLRPWYYNNFICNLFPIGWKQNKLIRILHQFTKNVIKERESTFNELELQQLIEDDGVQRKRMAMLDLLLHAKSEGSIDNEGIREEVDTFMFEGHDTTTAALTFAIMLLANNKEHQDKIFEELELIFGDSKRTATYDDLQKMHYLEICLKESMRLFPSVPLIAREINEDLQLTTFTAPAGCQILVHIYDIHRNPKHFPEPEKFDPNRFLPENVRNRHPFAYIPFSAGPRNCIGQKFAMLEMKMLMSAILRNFTLQPITKPEDIQIKIDLVLRSSCDVKVKFEKRQIFKQ